MTKSADNLMSCVEFLIAEQPPPVKIGVTEAGGITRRRGAMKHQKIHEVMGHQFIAKFFRQFTFCSFCTDFMW